MAKTAWVAVRHDPIERLEENLWRVEGDLPGGGPIRRTMVAARLGDGRLLIHNGIAMDEATMKELEAWGTPAFLIVPGERHRTDAAAYKARYPEAVVVSPPGAKAKAKVAEVVPVDRTELDLGDEVRWEPLEGLGGRECVLSVRSAAGTTLVLNDVVFNLRPAGGFGGFMLRLFGSTGPVPKVTPIARMLLVGDKPALRAHLERLAATPGLRRVIVAHGAPFDADGLRAAAAALS